MCGIHRKGVVRSLIWKIEDGERRNFFFMNSLTMPFSRERYVCVEPGHVRGYIKLEPGKTWIGQQVLSVIQAET